MYGQRRRKYFAPLNGDIKPDTPAIRALLQEGGWYEVDSQADELQGLL